MQPERDLFRIKVNLGVVLRGELPDLQALLREIQAFIEKRSDRLRLVFSEVSGDHMYIKKGDGP